MGYACPVCADPQADAGHLANHLAFTAMLDDEAHEEWLEKHAPGWESMGESELSEVAREAAEETEFPQVFDDTAGGLSESDEDPEERSGALFEGDHGHGHDHDHDHGRGDAPGGNRGGRPPMDEAAEAALQEAREMTRRMLEDDPESTDEDGSDRDGSDRDNNG